MKLKGFRNWSIFTKIMSISIFTLICVALGVLFYFLPLCEKKYMEEKKDGIKNVVDVVYAMFAEYETMIQKGDISKEDAQKKIIERVKGIRYKGNEYLWINDFQPLMIVHPIKPELDGKDVSDLADPHGKKLIVEAVKVCKENGEGFVEYMWPKPGFTQPVPKVSFVKAYKPWEWVVGTGIYVDDVQTEIANMRNRLIAATGTGSVLMLMIVFIVAGMITRPLKQSIKMADKMANGDFTVSDLDVKSVDEAGAIANALNKMKNKLNDLINTAMGNVRDTSGQVASASDELSMTIKNITKRLEDQTNRISQIASSTTEMSQTLVDVAKNTSAIATTSEDALKVAENGEDVVKEVIKETMSIMDKVAELSRLIKSLGERSKQIGEIVNVINDIADQTNLLALNAAIEAARAGEHGRGFAVVADEVRKLSERTTNATGEVGTMIKAIQSEMGLAVSTMDESQHKVEKGVDLSKKAGDALDGIVKSVNDLQLMAQQIASATEEMSVTSESISSDVEAIASLSKETTNGATDIEQASDNLAILSTDLTKVIGKFKV
jgi:methyl-accepting chemotaxis protein